MFDLGSWGEFLIILVVALVVLGPKELPHVFKTVGRWVYKIRQLTQGLRSSIDDMVHEAERQDIIKTTSYEDEVDDRSA